MGNGRFACDTSGHRKRGRPGSSLACVVPLIEKQGDKIYMSTDEAVRDLKNMDKIFVEGEKSKGRNLQSIAALLRNSSSTSFAIDPVDLLDLIHVGETGWGAQQ
jgi:hypothetical protein